MSAQPSGGTTPQTPRGVSLASAPETQTGVTIGANGVDLGATVWFTGLPSAGKSTIAHALAAELQAEGRRVQVLDGDEIRPHLSAGLGFTREDRNINVSRVGWVARLLASHGVIVLVPVIAPYAAARDAVRAAHDEAQVPFAEVFVSTSLTVAEQRDVKGLYAKARRGELSGMTGVDDPYERPAAAELVLDTAQVDLTTSVEMAKATVTAILRRPGKQADDVESEQS